MSVREITTAICNRGQLLFCRNALRHHWGQEDVGDRAELQGYQFTEGKKACQEPRVGTPWSLVTFSLLAPRLFWARQAQNGETSGGWKHEQGTGHRLGIFGSQQVSESFCTISSLPDPQTVLHISPLAACWLLLLLWLFHGLIHQAQFTLSSSCVRDSHVHGGQRFSLLGKSTFMFSSLQDSAWLVLSLLSLTPVIYRN